MDTSPREGPSRHGESRPGGEVAASSHELYPATHLEYNNATVFITPTWRRVVALTDRQSSREREPKPSDSLAKAFKYEGSYPIFTMPKKAKKGKAKKKR
jgi:hypothetical protein